MTLSRGPCMELDKMSLFQDLKLKRRKVDSRCSSDGESVADTSTSSPDLHGPLSPKMSEASRTSPKLHDPTRNSPSPAAVPQRASPDSVFRSEDSPSVIRSQSNSEMTVSEVIYAGVNASRLLNSVVRSSSSAVDVIASLKDAHAGGTLGGHVVYTITPTSGAVFTSQSQLIRTSSPIHTTSSQASRLAPSPVVSRTDPLLLRVKSEGCHQHPQVPVSGTVLHGPPVSVMGQIPSARTIRHSQSPVLRIKRERSPVHTMTQPQSPMHSPGQHRHAMPPMSPALLSPRNEAALLLRIKSESGQNQSMISTSIHSPNIQGQNPQIHCSMSQAHTITQIGAMSNAMTSRIQSPPHNRGVLNQMAHMYTQSQRINGVKPEIIGGHFPLRPPSTVPQQSSTPRSAPTVIMGESGGVRTMVWSYDQPQNTSGMSVPGPSTPSHQNAASEEAAAQLLLSLGGLGPPVRPPSRAPGVPTTVGQRTGQLPLNMERLWAGDLSQLPAGQQLHALNLSAQGQPSWMTPQFKDISSEGLPSHQEGGGTGNAEEDEQPMVCMICEDKATGLHYGIITCEGCKGFFKRTVQNRRVYTCVADGVCEITKAQRNRCQYCRFKKCIEQGMVLQAVREDRMPGGRNSGAVYNLYKVKYKKHKKSTTKNAQKMSQSPPEKSLTMSPPQTSISMNVCKTENMSIPAHMMNGTILKTALTNPSEIVHLRHRLDNAVSSSKDRSMSLEHTMTMIQTLIDCDAMEDIATLPHFPEFLEDKSEIGDKLCNIGDSIVHKLVSWTKKLPFYLEIPVEIHTKLLTDKWHELLVLTTAAYQAMHGAPNAKSSSAAEPEGNFLQEVSAHLCTLQTCLTTLMGHPISMEQLRLDVGLMVEKMTEITIMFRRIKLRMEEYVCLKVYILLNQEVELEGIQERYVQVLRSFLEHSAPHHPGRLHELLAHIPEIQAAASLLLESKMFYVPFVLNSANIR